MVFKNRVGGFFILVGLVCLAIFFFSEPAPGVSVLGVLTIGLALLVLGIIMKVKNHPPEEESARFQSFRQFNRRSNEQKAKRLAKRKEKEKQRRG
jgi:multisubunit Na+/H+ antiporter MnhB subunit